MDKVSITLIIATTILVTSDTAKIEIIEAPSKVAVTKPIPYGLDMNATRPNTFSKTLYPEKQPSSKTKLVNNEITNNTIEDHNSSSTHPEVKSWPKVFVLSRDPSYPVVCYSGISVNISKRYNNDTSIPTEEEAKSNTSTNTRLPRVFMLSSDPQFPVVCREGPIPANLAEFAEEETAESINITCIRRDYEQNISAIFLHNVGPIDTALNVFNSSISYGFNNVNINMESFGHIKILNETIVDCDKYGFQIDEKGISVGAAAALTG